MVLLCQSAVATAVVRRSFLNQLLTEMDSFDGEVWIRTDAPVLYRSVVGTVGRCRRSVRLIGIAVGTAVGLRLGDSAPRAGGRGATPAS